MKKVLCILLSALLLVTAAACGNNGDKEEATIIPMGETAENTAETAAPTEEPTETPEPTEAPAKAELITGITATADYSQGDYKPEYVVDGETYPEDSSMRWSCYNGNKKHWLLLDLGKLYTVTEGEIYFEYSALYYTLSISVTGEDNTWEIFYDSYEDDAVLGANADDCFYTNKVGQFIKLETYVPEDAKDELKDFWANSTGGACYFSIYEVEVYGTEYDGEPIEIATQDPAETPAEKTNIAVGKTITANSEESGHAPELCVDGDLNTRYSAYYIGSPEEFIVTLELGAVYNVGDVDIIFEFDAMYFEVLISETGEDGSWKAVYDTYEEDDFLGSGSEIEFDLNGEKAAFIRIHSYIPEDEAEEYNDWLSSTTGGHRYFSIYEWQVFEA